MLKRTDTKTLLAKLRSVNRFAAKYNYFPKYSNWLFILLFLVIAVIYSYPSILTKPPQSIHMWRQCDCLSITLNYYQDNNPFLEPSMSNLGYDGTGKTMSEFPLIYYTVGNLWKVFGQHEYIYRLIIVIIYFFGLFALFKMFERAMKDSFIAIMAGLLMFTSPVLVYYGNNFLMDIPALSLAMIGLFFFMEYYHQGKEKFLYLFFLFYLVAGLFKITSLLSFMAVAGLFSLELLGVKIRPTGKLFPNSRLRTLLLFSALIFVEFLWYSYAKYYNSHHNSGIFLIGTLPIWEMTKAQIHTVLEYVNVHIKWDYFRQSTQILFVLMFLSLLIFYKRVNRVYFLLTLITWAGMVCFLILFFQPLKDHDYYTINLFILIPIIIFSFLSVLKDHVPALFRSVWFKVVLIAWLVINISFASTSIHTRYSRNSWQDKTYFEYLQPFEEIGPTLDSLGIRKDEKVLSLSDNSINITLYQMNRKGWTNFGINSDSARIRDRINRGARYMLIYKDETLGKPGIKPYLGNKIGQYKNIKIFSLDNIK